MEKWEYLTKFFEANASKKEIKEFIKQNFEVNRPPRYTPEAMIPELNVLGDEGWELVHMEPVAAVGGKGDVRFEGSGSRWSNTYFCVFKRRKTVASVMPVTATGQPAFLVPQSPPPAAPAQPAPPPSVPPKSG